MKAKKTYFLVTPGSSPTVGSIALGNVISDPALPADALNQQHITFPPSIQISYSTPLKNWKWTTEPARKFSGGILAQFLGIIDFEIGARREKGTKREYFCKELETQSFQVSEEYINIIKAMPEIQTKVLRRENLYAITGIKIAKGATVNEEALNSLGFRLATTVDLTALGGAPVNIGPQTELDKSASERLEYDIETDFVLAYRLEEIYYRWRSVQSRPFGKEGDIHGLPQEQGDAYDDDDEEEEDTMDNFVFDDPQDHDLPAFVLSGLQASQVQDEDGETYSVVRTSSHPSRAQIDTTRNHTPSQSTATSVLCTAT